MNILGKKIILTIAIALSIAWTTPVIWGGSIISVAQAQTTAASAAFLQDTYTQVYAILLGNKVPQSQATQQAEAAKQDLLSTYMGFYASYKAQGKSDSEADQLAIDSSRPKQFQLIAQAQATKPPNTSTTKNANANNAAQQAANNAAAQLNTKASIESVVDWDETIGSFINPLNVESIPELITKIINILLTLIAMVAVVVIIISGFRMVIDAGNMDQVKKARQAITWAIIGLVVSLMAFSIVAIIQSLIQK